MIYITGDIHGAFDIHKINPDEFIPGRTLTSEDTVLICGDFGCIWDGGSSDRFWLNWLESLPWNTVFIDGNHENFDVLNSYPVEEWNKGKVHKIRSNIFHLMRGEVYEFEGHTWLAFGGGFSHDRPYRTEGKTWWKAELPTVEEVENAHKNLEKYNWNVDYILSHDVYASHPYASKYNNTLSDYDENQVNIQDALEEIRKKTNYNIWFSGHYHDDALCLTDGKPSYVIYNDVVKLDDLVNTKLYRRSDAMVEAKDEYQ